MRCILAALVVTLSASTAMATARKAPASTNPVSRTAPPSQFKTFVLAQRHDPFNVTVWRGASGGVPAMRIPAVFDNPMMRSYMKLFGFSPLRSDGVVEY